MSLAKKKLTVKPEAIIINVPLAFFEHDGKIQGNREDHFREYYESMGTDINPEGCFYHFISTVPIYPVHFAYVCFKGKIQYRANIVEFLKNKPVMLETYQHPEPRNWVITTGPVIKPPHEWPIRVYRGFRYSEILF